MMDNENMMTNVVEGVAETGMVEEVMKTASGKDVGVYVLIGCGIVLVGYAFHKLIRKVIEKPKDEEKDDMIARQTGYDEVDDITEDNLDIEDIEP